MSNPYDPPYRSDSADSYREPEEFGDEPVGKASYYYGGPEDQTQGYASSSKKQKHVLVHWYLYWYTGTGSLVLVHWYWFTGTGTLVHLYW